MGGVGDVVGAVANPIGWGLDQAGVGPMSAWNTLSGRNDGYGGAGSGGPGGKNSAPGAPDFIALAREQAALGQQAADAQTQANRPTQVTPWGTSAWQRDANGNWTQNVSLSPQQQAIFNAQQGNQLGQQQLAGGLLGNASSALSSPVSFRGAPAAAPAPTPAGMQTSLPIESMQRGLNFDSAPALSTRPTQQSVQGQQLQRGVATADYGGVPGLTRGNIQQGLDFGGAPSMPGVQDVSRQGFDAAYNLATSRLDPQWQQREDQTRTRLYNQGLREGDQAFDREMANLGQARTDAYGQATNQATLTGANLANQMFGQGLAARQQGVGEATTAGQFGNQAAQQLFGQGLAARQQGVGEQNSLFGQRLSAGQFGNQAANDSFDQALRAGNFANSAAGQDFQQGLSAGNFYNNAANQDFQNSLAARQQNVGETTSRGNFYNDAAQRMAQQWLNAGNFGNAARDQNFQEQLQAGNFQNQLRQQSIAEMLQQRNQSLNEYQALSGGPQVGMPQLPGFQGGGSFGPPNLLGGAQAQYGANLDAYNAGQAQRQGLLTGGLGLLSLLSDRRLKKEIHYLDDGPVPGVRWATWKWRGGIGGRVRGVIAQDVRRARPDLVSVGPGGFLAVDYGGLQ